jgi:hypothetical protein
MKTTLKNTPKKDLNAHFRYPNCTFKKKTESDGKEFRTGIRGQESGIGGQQPRGSYHLRETQAAYNSNFTPENSDLRAENAYLWRNNP